MTCKEQLLRALSLGGDDVPAKSNLAAQLLTEGDCALISGAGGYLTSGPYNQTSGNFSQVVVDHSQAGGGDYIMGTRITK